MDTIISSNGASGADDDVLLTTKQAAELCRVTRERMYTLANDGRVPSIFAHHQYRFSRNELVDILEKTPEILWQRRTVQRLVTAATRESRRATMLRLNAMQDRHEAGRRGLEGLKRKLAQNAGLDPENRSAENQQSIDLLYQAHMAEVRARRMAQGRHVTTEERVASVTKLPVGEAVAICYQCWRQVYGRPPSNIPNKLCAAHQLELDEYARQLRAAS